jgi:hypothetical protein
MVIVAVSSVAPPPAIRISSVKVAVLSAFVAVTVQL